MLQWPISESNETSAAVRKPSVTQLGFSYFEVKIRLIRLCLSFQKQKFLYLNSEPTDSHSGVMTITPKSQLWVEDTEKLLVTFSHARLILVEFT